MVFCGIWQSVLAADRPPGCCRRRHDGHQEHERDPGCVVGPSRFHLAFDVERQLPAEERFSAAKRVRDRSANDARMPRRHNTGRQLLIGAPIDFSGSHNRTAVVVESRTR